MGTTQTFRGVESLERGAKIHKRGTASSSAGSPIDVVSHTVTTGLNFRLDSVTGSCSKAGKWELFEDAVVVDTKRTSAARLNVSFKYVPTKDIGSAVVVKLVFTQNQGSTSDVEGLIQGAEF